MSKTILHGEIIDKHSVGVRMDGRTEHVAVVRTINYWEAASSARVVNQDASEGQFSEKQGHQKSGMSYEPR